MESAVLAGEVTWKEGLVLKGNGLCNGISGNAYALHSLFRAYKRLASEETDDGLKDFYEDKAKLWQTRTFMFAKAIQDPVVQDAC